jgi:ribosomal protein L37AE/L43A
VREEGEEHEASSLGYSPDRSTQPGAAAGRAGAARGANAHHTCRIGKPVGATSRCCPKTEAGLPAQPIAMRKGHEMKGSSPESRAGSLICPLCEAAQLRPLGHHSVRCESCGGSLSEAMLKTLRQITHLPDAQGSHACECGHPEMRLLPDGVFYCPSCGSEVVPIEAQATFAEHGEAWWAGWMDGHFGETGSFVYNLKLAKWEAPSDRLDYYRGHRAGSDARREEWSGHASKEVGAGSHLRDGVSWVWPGGMCWHRSLAARTVKSSETPLKRKGGAGSE